MLAVFLLVVSATFPHGAAAESRENARRLQGDLPRAGCTDESATNFDALATEDNGSCVCEDGQFKMMQHNRAVCSSFNGDLDGDRMVNALDILSLLGDIGMCDPRLISDGNGDGCVDVRDLLLLLPLFGTSYRVRCDAGQDAEDAATRGPWIELLAEAGSNALHANSEWWQNHCDAGESVPANDFVIMVKMGEVRDFFKGRLSEMHAGESLCTVLGSNQNHMWSQAPGGPWTTPAYDRSRQSAQLGGSALQWPRNNIDGDSRTHLSFWGGTGGDTGGCCSTTYAETSDASYGQVYSVYAAPASCFY